MSTVLEMVRKRLQLPVLGRGATRVDQHADLVLTAKLAEEDDLTVDAKNARARAKILEEEAAKNTAA